jgi:glycosyltransferase involved in cell wall biosynthesis
MQPQIDPPGNQPRKISVIVPVYNNQAELPATISELCGYFSEKSEDYELIFVDDGSTDMSAHLLKSASRRDSRIKILTHTRNQGQQAAVMSGLMASSGTTTVTVDADLPFPVSELHRCALLAETEAELVLGIRKGKSHAALWRRCASRFGNLAFRLLFPYNVQDFGCGTGAVRRSIIEKLRLQNNTVRIVKLELLQLVSGYVETELELKQKTTQVPSSYTPIRLLRLFLALLASRKSFGTRDN